MADVSYRVMKFGGSSVGSPERLTRVTDVVAEQRAEGPVAVVVSAMGDTTDWLIEAVDVAAAGDFEAAEAIVDRVSDLAIANGLGAMRALDDRGLRPDGVAAPKITPMVRERLKQLGKVLYGVSLLRQRTDQTLDLVMSFGERLSASVLAELLTARGLPAVYVDARRWTRTDDTFGTAIVDWEASNAALTEVAAEWGDRLPVHTGFLGRTRDGRTTTLGRNGSDYTATLLARGLSAREVVIWTDVSGVMTADPGIVREAYPLARLSYWEALELANFGARMFHPRTMIPLIESGTPMRIRNTMHPDHPGTFVDAKGSRAESQPTSVTSLENLALIDIEWRRLSGQGQVGERVLRALDEARIPVYMATQAAHGLAVAVAIPIGSVAEAEAVINEAFALEMARGEVDPLRERSPVTLLTLVAEAMGQRPNMAGRFFGSLGAVGVNVLAIAQGASLRSITCAIAGDDTSVAVRTVHAAFNFAHQEVNVFVLGKGVVGSHLLSQIAQQRDELEKEHDIQIRVVGVADSRRVLFDEEGIDLEAWEAKLREEPSGDNTEVDDLIPYLQQMRRLPVPVLVDCTAVNGMEALYEAAFESGVHVVAANKKPLAIDWAAREALVSSARRHHREYHYETTVGASLPVIDTLKNLVRTGDHIRLIEGSFSGTLGYLTNELMAGKKLSEAVRTARELGYTEPQPQDDLSGADVARKALILARELGWPMTIDEVDVEPFVPRDLLENEDLEAFFAALEAHDTAFDAQMKEIRESGRTLRYLARIEPEPGGSGATVRVGPVAVDADHPAVTLRGSEAFVSFTTERYQAYPLIVQGAGAGGAVTAAGVLADVLRIAQSLRGR